MLEIETRNAIEFCVHVVCHEIWMESKLDIYPNFFLLDVTAEIIGRDVYGLD